MRRRSFLHSAALVALAAKMLFGFDWRVALLLGAIVGSTDAAAVLLVELDGIEPTASCLQSRRSPN